MADEHDPAPAAPTAASEDKAVPDDTQPAQERSTAEAHPTENAKNDREVAAISRTIQPKSDAPSRSGIKGSGSGADG